MKADGSLERYKACLVVKSYSQLEGFDYQETFNFVAKQTLVSVFMAIATAQRWCLSYTYFTLTRLL
ncbi:Reverse transcriptase [Theobroma cacao]|nr:Reverse transcriptase [Theobroma cacao]WRX11514.1 Reverse transcriptase [Theobroma cacao]